MRLKMFKTFVKTLILPHMIKEQGINKISEKGFKNYVIYISAVRFYNA